MTRFSATFLLAALATSVLKTGAAPLHFDNQAEARAVQQSAACSNITSSLNPSLSSALSVLGKINTSDGQVSKDLATLKQLLTTASTAGNGVTNACNAAVAAAKAPTTTAVSAAQQSQAKAALAAAASQASAVIISVRMNLLVLRF
ncbi:hypothetical protein C8R45DRAFT_416990 [Mycena sanguinolenta]|nr:hypothetical protein C8R45DRAFT_416990 [Mycena sanguinolenta]